MNKNKDSCHRDKGRDEGWEKGQAVCVLLFPLFLGKWKARSSAKNEKASC